VIRQSSGMTAVLPHPASNPSQRPFSRTGPSAAPAGWSPASVRPYSLANGPPSGNSVLPSSTPAPSVLTGSGHHPMPMGMHDRTPSFGAGVNSSFHGMPPPKRSATAIISVIAVGLVGLALIGVVVLRMSARGRAGDSDPTAASAGAAFTIDVQSTPDGAVFELDGAAVGSGHLTRQFPRDGQKHVLRVSAPGYETLLVQFDEARPPPTMLALRASAQPVASTTLAGGGSSGNPANTAPKPLVNAPRPNPGPAPGPPPKGKPTDRPRTDNIDPWE